MEQIWQGPCQSSGHHSKAGLKVPARHCHCVRLIADQKQQQYRRSYSPLLQPTDNKLHQNAGMEEYEPDVQPVKVVDGLTKMKVLLEACNIIPANSVVGSFAASM